jgi:hypothetical protein
MMKIRKLLGNIVKKRIEKEKQVGGVLSRTNLAKADSPSVFSASETERGLEDIDTEEPVHDAEED